MALSCLRSHGIGRREIRYLINIKVCEHHSPPLPVKIDHVSVQWLLSLLLLFYILLVVISVQGSWGVGSGEGGGGQSVSPSSVPGWHSTLHHAPGLARKVQEVRQQSWPGGKKRGWVGWAPVTLLYLSCKGRGWYVVDGWSLRTYLIF